MRAGQDCNLLEKSLQTALALPWGRHVLGFNLLVKNQYLSYFFTTQWLTDDHEALMLDLLQSEVALSAPHQSVAFPSVFLRTSILLAFENPASYAQDKQETWLRDLGQTYSSSRSTVLMISNLNSNHWVAIVLDFSSHVIRYGDSFNHSPSLDTLSALKWWTHFHTGKHFAVVLLPITQQTDGHSCGLLAWNALAHFVLPEKFPLFNASKMCDERLQMFLRILSVPKVSCTLSSSSSYN
ncbi:hypothetical protein BDZ97DRAFT_1670915 [Flammula alnicola]|nr:hypothetical protein BDZ97DRAFT_1670915 [Flammula alnicola]